MNNFTGSDHYKTGSIEPIDLYKSGGMFQDYALTSIIKYAFRNRKELNRTDYDKIILDMTKIKDLADKLIIFFNKEINSGNVG
ncbi:MAG TPA: DUF3310 domain-containing protein [Bacteroidales bacterium]|nr:DUF3310 domain-containing protein [Bacteroidales bacterium]